MGTDDSVTHLAHLRNATYRDAQHYIAKQHPELMEVTDPGRIEYRGYEAAMWIHQQDPTVVVAAVRSGNHIDIYRTMISEFFANSSYEPTGDNAI